MQRCVHCDGETSYRLRLYNNHAKKSVIDPKWLPHIQIMCGECGRYNATIKQDESLRRELDGMTMFKVDYQAVSELYSHLKKNI